MLSVDHIKTASLCVCLVVYSWASWYCSCRLVLGLFCSRLYCCCNLVSSHNRLDVFLYHLTIILQFSRISKLCCCFCVPSRNCLVGSLIILQFSRISKLSCCFCVPFHNSFIFVFYHHLITVLLFSIINYHRGIVLFSPFIAQLSCCLLVSSQNCDMFVVFC